MLERLHEAEVVLIPVVLAEAAVASRCLETTIAGHCLSYLDQAGWEVLPDAPQSLTAVAFLSRQMGLVSLKMISHDGESAHEVAASPQMYSSCYSFRVLVRLLEVN